jgi:tRNA A-37 threonylcarbamoyl transferase component Bud32
LKPLQGGASAYVWLIEGLLDKSKNISKQPRQLSEPCIMKFGDSVGKNTTIEVSGERMINEGRAMNADAVAKACSKEPAVAVPRLLNQTNDAVFMSLAGETDLRSAYIKDQDMDARYVGARIGRWAASLHMAGLDDPDMQFWTNKARGQVRDMELDSLRAAFTARSDYTEEEIARALATVRASDCNQTISIWDFRPMNVLLKPGLQATRPGITIVDFEMCSYGDAATDLRMWIAEAMVLESQHGRERGLLDSFLTAYRQEAGDFVDVAFVCRVAILVGSMYEFLMPCSLWDCTADDTEEWKVVAHEYIRAGLDRDEAWLKQSRLAPLLNRV